MFCNLGKINLLYWTKIGVYRHILFRLISSRLKECYSITNYARSCGKGLFYKCNHDSVNWPEHLTFCICTANPWKPFFHCLTAWNVGAIYLKYIPLCTYFFRSTVCCISELFSIAAKPNVCLPFNFANLLITMDRDIVVSYLGSRAKYGAVFEVGMCFTYLSMVQNWFEQFSGLFWGVLPSTEISWVVRGATYSGN